MIRSTIGIFVSLAGVAAALTLLFLGMRSVMDVGGFCASGGPYVIETECPQGIPAIVVGSILGGIVLSFVYVGVAVKNRVPSFAALLWPALFLSLGWNFMQYAFDAPGPDSGIVWGWLLCGIVFMLMGGLPLIGVLPWVVRGFTRDDEPRAGWPGGVPVEHMRRAAARVAPAAAGAGGGRGSSRIDDLERLASLHERGALDDDEFEAAKRELLGGSW